MAETKRIGISLPESLLQEVDLMLRTEHRRNRSEFIRMAMRFYMLVKQRRQVVAQMQEGYPAMGEINLALAEELSAEEQDLLGRYEEWLAELERHEDRTQGHESTADSQG